MFINSNCCRSVTKIRDTLHEDADASVRASRAKLPDIHQPETFSNKTVRGSVTDTVCPIQFFWISGGSLHDYTKASECDKNVILYAHLLTCFMPKHRALKCSDMYYKTFILIFCSTADKIKRRVK
jgi:hypothetical protein